jgi:Putative addiction module component
MNQRVKKLTEEIRKLSPDEQADLMEELLVISYGKPPSKSDKAWAEEIDRRIEVAERDAAKTVDALRKYKKKP